MTKSRRYEREREREREKRANSKHSQQAKKDDNKQTGQTGGSGSGERGGLLVQEASDSYSTREMSDIMRAVLE